MANLFGDLTVGDLMAARRINLLRHGCSMPVRVDPDFPGSVQDADGREILVIDPNLSMSDESVAILTILIVDAINQYCPTDQVRHG